MEGEEEGRARRFFNKLQTQFSRRGEMNPLQLDRNAFGGLLTQATGFRRLLDKIERRSTAISPAPDMHLEVSDRAGEAD